MNRYGQQSYVLLENELQDSIMDSSPSSGRRAPGDTSDSLKKIVVPDSAPTPTSFLTPSHGNGTSGDACSTGSMAIENPTVAYSKMLGEAYAAIRAGNRSTIAYERTITVFKELKLQLEETPADEMPVRH
jgi:hypothetical protein